MKVLITGGCGFIGSHLAIRLKGLGHQVWALDNLSRQGSELNAQRLMPLGVQVVQADVLNAADLSLPAMDAMILAAAEPSVSAGLQGAAGGVVDVNLKGTLVCLELARRWSSRLVFLSTSRVYSIAGLRTLEYRRSAKRFEWCGDACPGFCPNFGISEDFSTAASRSLYGATKLASEIMLSEYSRLYGLGAVINRFGLVAGPWQMARADQGVITLWVARHQLGLPLRYIGFDGQGHQVRDVLHVDDLCELVMRQLEDISHWHGHILNVGGGMQRSISLRELTELCVDTTGNRVDLDSQAVTNAVDIPIYITDNRRIESLTDWRPQRSVEQTVDDISEWIRKADPAVKRVVSG